MSGRKYQLMQKEFGNCPGHVCGECSNLVKGDWNHTKCKVYGVTSSQASDWAKRWLACGMFNKTYTGRPIIELVRRSNPRPPATVEEPMEGQMKLEV